MPLFTEITKTKLINRARALGVLSWPILVLAAVVAFVFIAGRSQRRIPANVGEPSRESGALSATSAGASVEIRQRLEGAGKSATTVTTYTITGKY